MNIAAKPPAPLQLGQIETRISRIRCDAADIQASIELVTELRKLSPIAHPVADIRAAAISLHDAARALDRIILAVE